MTRLVKLVDRLLQYSEVRDLLVELARQETPETELQEEEPRILDFIQQYVAPWLRDAGMATVSFDSGGSLLGRAGHDRTGRSLLLLSYAMNHASEGMPDSYSGAVLDGARFGTEGECVWGRGLCEQKGPLAAMLAAVRATVASGVELAGSFLFGIVTSGESGRHDAVKRLIEEQGINPGICILGIGTNNRICLGNKGNVKVLVRVHGTPAHISQPWLGRNAIDGGIALVQLLKELPPLKEHPTLGSPAVTVEGIRSDPFGESTVPATCDVAVDRRLVPGESPEAAFEELKTAIGAELAGYPLSYRTGGYQYPAEISRATDSYTLLASAIRAMLGREPQEFYSASALDAGFLLKRGTETIQFGPGDMRFAHTAQEFVPVKDVWDAARVLSYAILSHLGEPGMQTT